MEPQDRELDFSGTYTPRLKDIPREVRLMTYARAIRWIGWGFGESLLPIFILSFSTSVTETGLINSAYEISFLLALPLIGLLSDVISGRTLVIVALFIYPFISLSYWLGGLTGAVLFIIIAKTVNGVAYCMDSIGNDTYIRRMTPGRIVASAFGYMASVANLAWLLAALAGIYLVHYVSIGNLLLLVAPFSLLGFLPLIHAADDTPKTSSAPTVKSILKPLITFLKEIAALKKGLNHVVFLMFALDVAYITATFFIPIAAYKAGASLSGVALLAVIGSLPALFEFWLAEFIDGNQTKRAWALSLSLVALPVLFVCAAFTSTLLMRTLVAFGVETAAIFGGLALQSYATMLSRRERYGEISSVLEGAASFGYLVGPIALGLLADTVGFTYTFFVIAGIFLTIAFHFLKNPIESGSSHSVSG